MKKSCLAIILFFLVSAFCTVMADSSTTNTFQGGESFYFGAIEQDNNEANGFEPIEWLVIDVEGDRALLLSRYAIECRSFNEEKAETSWESSDLRVWLNGEFLSTAFSETEQQAILLSSVSNAMIEGNGAWAGSDSDDTSDRIFLLSFAEATFAFDSPNARKAQGTEYARAKGAKFLGLTSVGIGETDWWLRSPGKNGNEASYIDVRGAAKTRSVADRIGVRPALWIDLTVDLNDSPYMRFMSAAALAEGGGFAEAAEIFESLDGYNDSAALAKECRYQQAIAAAAAEEYDEAIKLFVSLDGYEDSYNLARGCRYAEAVAYQEAGDFETAAKMFGKVGQYEDSMIRMKACFEKLGISIYYFDVDTVDTGTDRGYSLSNVIDGNSQHFGWRLGRFFMSGFTRVASNSSGQPLFIKTLGDSVTLWFDLEQNIDALNGQSSLIVAEDANGYNQYFGVKKMNFGRGTLIVRHTDYQNSKGTPQIYTDYLLAKGTTGADTKVILNEEGDYEVALDYELQDNDITHITSKYRNYQILFSFSVRNGNCMIYPFDVVTGAELQNTAVTENGFYLDLARSRYLDIDVKRSVIVEGPAGMIEDERFNRPAKDGDQYTAEGIYTISVSNRYTGESTVKTIFVGSDELLREYIENGFSMDRLK